MDDQLHKYLKERWKKDNHKKYQKYFSQWVGNITDNQAYYFRKDMIKESRE